MKKSSIIKALACSLVLAASLPLSAQAFTGLFGDNTGITISGDSELQVSQANWLSAGMKIPLSANGTSYFAVQASGNFNMFYMTDGTIDYAVTADLDLLKLNAVFKNKDNDTLTISSGRFPFSDATGLIFAQPADGAIIQIRTQQYSASVSASYTGLISGKSSAMMDSTGNVASAGTDLQFYSFASPYLAASASYSMPYLFSNQTLGIEALGIFDMPGVGIAAGDDPSPWRAYATAFLNGPVASFIFYDFTATFGFPGTLNPSLLATANISIYPGFLGSAFNFSAVYASGENGFLKPFVGFTRISAAPTSETTIYSGKTKVGAQVSLKPTDKFYISTDGYAVFDNSASSFSYYGTEAGFTAIYQLFTDVQFRLNAETFIAPISSSDLSKTSISLNAVISF